MLRHRCEINRGESQDMFVRSCTARQSNHSNCKRTTVGGGFSRVSPLPTVTVYSLSHHIRPRLLLPVFHSLGWCNARSEPSLAGSDEPADVVGPYSCRLCTGQPAAPPRPHNARPSVPRPSRPDPPPVESLHEGHAIGVLKENIPTAEAGAMTCKDSRIKAQPEEVPNSIFCPMWGCYGNEG